MKIIVDAMGGDNAPQAPVMGAVQANREYGVDIILVGRGEAILKVLEENGIQELPAGRGDRPRQRGGGDVRQPGHRLPGEEGLLSDPGAEPAEKRRRRRLRVRRLHRRPAGWSHFGGQAHQGYPPGGPSSRGTHRKRGSCPYRLWGQRRVSPGVPAPVRLHGLLLRRACARPSQSPKWVC